MRDPALCLQAETHDRRMNSEAQTLRWCVLHAVYERRQLSVQR